MDNEKITIGRITAVLALATLILFFAMTLGYNCTILKIITGFLVFTLFSSSVIWLTDCMINDD